MENLARPLALFRRGLSQAGFNLLFGCARWFGATFAIKGCKSCKLQLAKKF
jgi:hypothetical protein